MSTAKSQAHQIVIDFQLISVQTGRYVRKGRMLPQPSLNKELSGCEPILLPISPNSQNAESNLT
jgi:hypothetical protein